MTFTAHNILLPDGPTIPGSKDFVSNSSITRGTLAMLRLGLKSLKDKTIADLGCLEGGYTVEFARAGMSSTGIEVRESNYANCKMVLDAVGLPNLRFVHDDAWNLSAYSTFDAIFCSGLLYHLDRPAAFIDLLGRQARKMVILHTHFAREDNIQAFPHLSELTENEGYPGRWYAEHPAVPRKELELMKWSSWENQRSFWLTAPAIHQLLKSAGFDIVVEQTDWLDGWQGGSILSAMTSGYHRTQARGMFVGIRCVKGRQQSGKV